MPAATRPSISKVSTRHVTSPQACSNLRRLTGKVPDRQLGPETLVSDIVGINDAARTRV